MRSRIVLLLLSVFAARYAFADIFTPSNTCKKPTRPYQFSSQWEIDSFKSDVEVYKQCIERFVREQQEQADNHRQAAAKAIDEWNSFVRYELR